MCSQCAACSRTGWLCLESLHVPADFPSVFTGVDYREHWPAACILSDLSPQTIDTLQYWAHKEPHTPGPREQGVI